MRVSSRPAGGTQQVDWTWAMVRDTVLDLVLSSNPEVPKRIRADLERQVRDGELTPALAAQQILDAADGWSWAGLPFGEPALWSYG